MFLRANNYMYLKGIYDLNLLQPLVCERFLTDTRYWEGYLRVVNALPECGEDIVWSENDIWAISARLRSNLDKLEEFLVRSAALPSISSGDVVVTNVRHYEALTRALKEIKEVKHSLELGLSGDLVSEHLRAAIHHLGEIVGEVTNDEVLGNIFANFCIGK